MSPALNDLAVAGRLTDTLLDDARRLASLEETTVLSALQKITGWSPEVLVTALGAAFQYPVLTLAVLEGLVPQLEKVHFHECIARGVMHAKNREGQEWVVLTDPFDFATEEWAVHRCTHARVTPQIGLAHSQVLQSFLQAHENVLKAMDGVTSSDETASVEDVAAEISITGLATETSAVIKLVNSTLYDALKAKASDIHLECDVGALHVLYRIDGVLVPITRLNNHDQALGNFAEQVISRIKVMAELDIAERRIPQDGRFKIRVTGRTVDFRVSIMPNIFGEDAVLRLLDRQTLTQQASGLVLDDLGLDADSIRRIRFLSRKPHGMLLVTGPTGSGKTTTLYAAITEIHTGQEKIVTIEDPVEYRLPRVLQIPVNEKKGLTFARGLRSILRHDPDKIMVGEIRDSETAQIAVQAALTGHLVYTSVHANNVFDVLGRFLHMGVDSYSFASALNGIVAQRLLRLNCSVCAQASEPSEDTLSAASLTREQVTGWRFCSGRGCATCRNSGYSGRVAIAEVLQMNDELRELIATKASVTQLKERAAAAGWHSIHDRAMQYVESGKTTLEEVIRVAG